MKMKVNNTEVNTKFSKSFQKVFKQIKEICWWQI